MDKVQYLLTCISEEGAEVIKEACKSARFGPLNEYRDQGLNFKLLLKEFYELFAVTQMAAEELGLEPSTDQIAFWVEDKRRRVLDTMVQSQTLGMLDQEAAPAAFLGPLETGDTLISDEDDA